MHGKTNWAVIALDTKAEQAFKDMVAPFVEEGSRLTDIDNRLREEGGTEVGFSSYAFPLGDIEDTLDCQLSEGVYGCWYTKLEETTLQDPKTLQEHLSYIFYSSPFRFLPKEQKEDIQDMMTKEPRTIKRTAVPMILDFNMGYLWVSCTSKAVLTDVREYLAEKEITTEPLVLDFGTNDWPRQVLSKIAEGDLLIAEFLKRAEDVKACGNPKSVEPHEDAQIEKILKKYFRGAEHDGYNLYLAAPAKLCLTNEMTLVGAATPWDATEVLNQGGLGVAQARLTVMESGSEKLDPSMSIDISDNFHIEPGFVLFKGLEPHTLGRALKETATVNRDKGGLGVKEYWVCDYVENQTAVGRFIELVKSILDIQGDYGLKRAEAPETKTEVLD